ncbi:cytochrome c oxidase assembly protein COX16 homolog l(3)neo43 [Lasioglossum baleicum]|uniref:cytochrome c oxidase assembly protein COX16 homolog l(3)neo43 n=1 Tax=Lasioglossum baleicum TaxID=434251 RepID=UPI003FCE96CA
MSQFFQTKTFRYFVPFMVLVVGGSFALREVAEIRYKYRKTTSYDIRRDAEKLGIKMKKSAPLEEIYEDMQKNVDITNWENVRIPRPWDEK